MGPLTKISSKKNLNDMASIFISSEDESESEYEQKLNDAANVKMFQSVDDHHANDVMSTIKFQF